MSKRLLPLAMMTLLVACTPARGTASTTSGTGASTTASHPVVSTDPAAGVDLVCWSAPVDTSPGPIQFEDVTEQVGLVEPLIGLYGHSAAFGLVNGDLFPDLVVGTFADREPEEYQVRGAEGPAPDRLLLTEPDLTLAADWSTELARTWSAVFTDFDADGDNDLLLIRHAGRDGDFPVPTRLFENIDGALQPHSEPLPTDFRGRTAAVADYDGDGLLDVYVSEDNSGETGGLLLRNESGLEFTDVTETSEVGGVFALGATAGDLNGDLLPDLVTSTAVFVNRGDTTFEDVTPDNYQAVPIGEEDDPAGVALGDLNHDGITDIVVGQHYRATVEFDSEVPVRVFLGTGDVTFLDATEEADVTPLPTLAPHVDLADLDNDGWLDIVTTASAGDGTVPAVYRNTGDEDLGFEVSTGLGSDQYWIGGPVTDIDHDGRLDVFAVEWEPSLPSIMFRNAGDGGHWLEVSLGIPGGGIGSLVRVYDGSGEMIGSQEIGVGGGYSSGRLPVAHFGLGQETVVDVTIAMPDGTTQNLSDITADQHIRWPEGC